MNLQTYVKKYGTLRLVALAVLADVKFGHLLNLLYTVSSGHNPVKTPSIKLAKKLSDLTFGELTMEGLATPERMRKDEYRPRMPKGFHDWLNSLGNDDEDETSE